MIVASLNYRKPLIHRFPITVLDIAAVACAVIEGECWLWASDMVLQMR